MKPKLCPTCQRPVPQDEIEALFTKLQRRIYRAVADAGSVGLTKWQVLEKAYFDDPSGGPGSPNIIRVSVCKMNKALREHGLKIRADNRTAGNYRLEACE